MDRRIKYALRIMKKNYGNPLRLSQLAGQTNLSQSRFEHLFKQDVGKTYKSYLRDVRMTKAKGFLKDLHLNISEVAYKVGYSYLPNFARDFKNRFGKTPSQYRKEML